MKYFVLALIYLSILSPVFIWYGSANLSFDKAIVFEIFPVLGLIAFVIMWLHIVGGALRGWLEKYIDFQKFVANSSIAVLLLLFLHPALLLFGIGSPSKWGAVLEFGDPRLIWIAVVAWFILVGYDVAKKFKTRKFFVKHWQSVKLISTLGFFLILPHSLGLGRNLQDGPLRTLWIIYGITAGIAAVYNYGLKKS